jgi:hypothetical protein
VSRTLNALGIVHTFGGPIASSVAGEPRSTLDIDVAAAFGESDVRPLVRCRRTSMSMCWSGRSVKGQTRSNAVSDWPSIRQWLDVTCLTVLSTGNRHVRRLPEADDALVGIGGRRLRLCVSRREPTLILGAGWATQLRRRMPSCPPSRR